MAWGVQLVAGVLRIGPGIPPVARNDKLMHGMFFLSCRREEAS